MEFVDKECPKCGKKLGNRKPKDIVELDKPYTTIKRSVSFVAPCPFCGENIPLWVGQPEAGEGGEGSGEGGEEGSEEPGEGSSEPES